MVLLPKPSLSHKSTRSWRFPKKISIRTALAMASSTPSDLIRKVTVYVQDYMKNWDGSHDFGHIKRVVSVAHAIYDEMNRTEAGSFPLLNRTVITLGALLHDVGDRKYLQEGEDQSTMVLNLLLQCGADKALAEKVQTICLAVSYNQEIKDFQKVKDLIVKYPELAVVQDADRLDSIGAVGIGRLFTYGGAKTKRSMAGSVQHFDEKLLKLEDLMKTEPGRRMAKERTYRLKTFREWWEKEVGIVNESEEWLV